MRILICKRSFIIGQSVLFFPSLGLLYIHAQVKSQQITIISICARQFDLLIIDSLRDGPVYIFTPSGCCNFLRWHTCCNIYVQV